MLPVSARTLIWTPMPTAEVQRRLHEVGVGPSALVPVPTGTVLLPPPSSALRQNLVIPDTARKLAGASLLVYWNDDAAVVVAFGSAFGRGWSFGASDAVVRLNAEVKRPGAVGRVFDRLVTVYTQRWRAQEKHRQAALAHLVKVLPQADEEQVAQRLADWETGGPRAVTGMLEALALPDVAKVADLAGEGRADLWLHQLPAPRALPRWYRWVFAVVLVGSAIAAVQAGLPGPLAAVVVLPLTIAWVTYVVRVARQPVKGKPINTALPVIPVTQGSAPTE